MAPPSADTESTAAPGDSQDGYIDIKPFPDPLKYSGSLDEYEQFDVTSVIGREFPKAQLSEILKDDKKIRDLAITGADAQLFRYSSALPY